MQAHKPFRDKMHRIPEQLRRLGSLAFEDEDSWRSEDDGRAASSLWDYQEPRANFRREFFSTSFSRAQ